jgi:hypothetical protein
MSGIVTSTADILAILGGCTTFAAAIFAAVRLSRCQTVTCCWGAFSLVNKPLPVAPPSAPAPLVEPSRFIGVEGAEPVRGESDLTSVAVQA